MIVGNINSTYFINSIKDYNSIKYELLDKIHQTQNSSIETPYESIYSSDWNVGRDVNRPYLNYFLDMIKPYLNDIKKYLMYDEYSIKNLWFQRYGKENKHDWHCHPENHFTNVFYVDLPDKSLKTEIIDPLTKEIINYIDVKEGDLLTLPAQVLHRSPINKTDKIKTIISFNLNMHKADFNLIKDTLEH